MATIKTLGDVITGIQNQSKSGVTFSVALQANGLYGVLRNGVLTWQFQFSPSLAEEHGRVRERTRIPPAH